MNIRIGQGFDVHPFGVHTPGSNVVLGGVAIPHSKPLVGHSDADVLTHAVMDALLGAAGLQDIGHFFPNTDNRFKGARSVDLLREVVSQIATLGWRVINIDCTLICEAPKISPYVDAMKGMLADRIGITSDAVGIKATTTEKLGSIGRSEGIVAMAVALISKA